MVADYVKETNNHVLYRVTPIFEGDNLLAKGVTIEAASVEDKGEEILFHVFCYNVQPGIVLDYKTGESKEAANSVVSSDGNKVSYILNTNSKKFHLPDCSSAKSIKQESKKEWNGTREELMKQGYSPCGVCKP